MAPLRTASALAAACLLVPLLLRGDGLRALLGCLGQKRFVAGCSACEKWGVWDEHVAGYAWEKARAALGEAGQGQRVRGEVRAGGGGSVPLSLSLRLVSSFRFCCVATASGPCSAALVKSASNPCVAILPARSSGHGASVRRRCGCR